MLHFTPALSLGHLVTNAKLGSATITSAAGRQGIRSICALEVRNVAVLHRVMMGTGNIWNSQ